MSDALADERRCTRRVLHEIRWRDVEIASQANIFALLGERRMREISRGGLRSDAQWDLCVVCAWECAW